MKTNKQPLLGIVLITALCIIGALGLFKQTVSATEGDTTWQNDYTYYKYPSFDTEFSNRGFTPPANYIYLQLYNGNATTVVVPSEAVINGQSYTTVVGGCFQNKDSITSVSFERGCVAYTLMAMFSGCTNLRSVDFSNLDTHQVKEANSLFHDCTSLEEVNLSSLDLSHVTWFFEMFFGCENLKRINFTGINTSSAVRMEKMFVNCSSLESLDLSAFNTLHVTSLEHMFQGCSNLKSIRFGSNFQTPACTNMQMMFHLCSSLQSLDLSNFDVSNLTNGSNMFTLCDALTVIDAPKNIQIDNINLSPDYDFYLDDNKDGNPDSSTKYEYMLRSTTSHRYIGLLNSNEGENKEGGNNQGGSGNENNISNTYKIKLSHNKLKLGKGGTFQMDFSVSSGRVYFSSSNKKVASVTNSGYIKAKNKGKCIITATAEDGTTATCNLTVQNEPIKIKKLKILKKKLTIKKGHIYYCVDLYNLAPYNATIAKISITSSDKKVVKVKTKGQALQAVEKGTCYINIKITDKSGKSKTGKVKVTVK